MKSFLIDKIESVGYFFENIYRDIRFSFMKKWWKYQTTKGIEFVKFDICETVIKVAFRQFVYYYEGSRKQSDYDDKKFMMELKKDATTQYEDTIKARSIYNYITKTRVENTKKLSDIEIDHSEYVTINIEECNGFSKTKVTDKTPYNITYKFNKNDELTITKKPLKKGKNDITLCLSLIEKDLFNLDNRYAIELINIRGSLWD